MPIFDNVPEKLVRLIQDSQYLHTTLTPSTARKWLRGNITVGNILDIPTAMKILQYVSQDERMDQLYDLPIFACKDRKLRSLSKISANACTFSNNLYVGTPKESSLFDETGQLFLHLEEYPDTVLARIHTHIAKISTVLSLKRFDLPVFRRFALEVLFSSFDENYDCIELASCGITLPWIQDLWHWMDAKPTEDVAEAVQSLCLIPVMGGKLQKVHTLFYGTN